MPTRFDLPVLGARDYAQLLAEATTAIPRYSDTWTDFNDSDPGTTLLQLLAWLGDITLYRIDSLPFEVYLNFGRWLVGASGEALDDLIDALQSDVLRDADGDTIYLGDAPIVVDPGRLAFATYLRGLETGAARDLGTLRAEAMTYWRRPYRAIGLDDFARLALEVTANVTAADPIELIEKVIVRIEAPAIAIYPVTAYCFDLDVEPSDAIPTPPVLLVVTATIQNANIVSVSQRYDRLVDAVRLYLAPRRLIGTPVRVRQPLYNPVTLVLRVAVLPNAETRTVLPALIARLQALLSPTTGGSDGTGWPYGKALTPDDVMAMARAVPGVDPSQPIDADVTTLPGLVVGTSLLGKTSLLGHGPTLGLPQLWLATLEARASTWTLQVGMHARVGLDTTLAGTRTRGTA